MLRYVVVFVFALSTIAMADPYYECYQEEDQHACEAIQKLGDLREQCNVSKSKEDCDRSDEFFRERVARSIGGEEEEEEETDGIVKHTVLPSRVFSGPNQYPPRNFAAYGIVAFRSRPSVHDRDRYVMICHAYISTLPHASELEAPSTEQMVTVWPLDRDNLASQLNYGEITSTQDSCGTAVDNYGLVISQAALKEAEYAGVPGNTAGPLLLAWSPPTDKGRRDALVLVSDLSDVTTYDQAWELFLAWSRDIERDPTLWSKGWRVEALRRKIQLWVDKYGDKTLAAFGWKD